MRSVWHAVTLYRVLFGVPLLYSRHCLSGHSRADPFNSSMKLGTPEAKLGRSTATATATATTKIRALFPYHLLLCFPSTSSPTTTTTGAPLSPSAVVESSWSWRLSSTRMGRYCTRLDWTIPAGSCRFLRPRFRHEASVWVAPLISLLP